MWGVFAKSGSRVQLNRIIELRVFMVPVVQGGTRAEMANGPSVSCWNLVYEHLGLAPRAGLGYNVLRRLI